MSSETQKFTKFDLEGSKNLFSAEVLDFPKDKLNNKPKIFKTNNNNLWKLYDKANTNEDGDQLKTVIGICVMFGALFITGLYSTLI